MLRLYFIKSELNLWKTQKILKLNPMKTGLNQVSIKKLKYLVRENGMFNCQYVKDANEKRTNDVDKKSSQRKNALMEKLKSAAIKNFTD